jgi:uncharacterized protein YdhG (YjbR/CyaY superfamily)
MKNAATVDEYISGFPAEVQVILEKVRDTIRRAAPDAEEGIAYGMPAYRLHKKATCIFRRVQQTHRVLCPFPQDILNSATNWRNTSRGRDLFSFLSANRCHMILSQG